MKRIFAAAGMVAALIGSLSSAAAEQQHLYQPSRDALLSSGFSPAGKPGEMPGFPEARSCPRGAACTMRWIKGRTIVDVRVWGWPAEIQDVRCVQGC